METERDARQHIFTRTMNKPGRGIAAMVAAGLLVTANDAAVKWVSAEHPSGQLVFVRGLFVLIIIGFIVFVSGGLATLRVKRYDGQIIRASLTVAGTFLFLLGLRALPLAEVITISFASPIFVTVLAFPLLGERVGLRRWAAVLVGFLGVLMILRPSPEGLNWAVLFPLGAALSESIKDIVTRRMHATEHTNSILLFSSTCVVVASLVTLPAGWSAMRSDEVALLAVAGVLIGVAYFLLIEAYRFAEASLVSPFKYGMIVWALLFGVVIWGDGPSVTTSFGLLLIIGSGIYIAQRETRQRKRQGDTSPHLLG